jgi:hypothetical protein
LTIFKELLNKYINTHRVESDKTIYSIRKFIYDLIVIAKIYNGKEWAVYRDDNVNRVHTLVTSLRSELRHFIEVQRIDESLVSVDLSNSQVFLVNLELQNAGIDLSAPDVVHFRELSSSGKFYEFIQEQTGYQSRNRVKTKFFSGYFFCANDKSNRDFEEVMAYHFPTIHDHVWREKKTDYKSFSIGLQRAESEFFIDRILPRLIQESPSGSFSTTLHDSVITNESNKQLVERIILEEFAKEELYPKVKIEEYGFNQIFESREMPPCRIWRDGLKTIR